MRDLIDRALAEDLGEGDLTSLAVVPQGSRAKARIRQKAPGVAAGMGVAQAVFQRVDPALQFVALAREGQWREEGPVAELEPVAAA